MKRSLAVAAIFVLSSTAFGQIVYWGYQTAARKDYYAFYDEKGGSLLTLPAKVALSVSHNGSCIAYADEDGNLTTIVGDEISETKLLAGMSPETIELLPDSLGNVLITTKEDQRSFYLKPHQKNSLVFLFRDTSEFISARYFETGMAVLTQRVGKQKNLITSMEIPSLRSIHLYQDNSFYYVDYYDRTLFMNSGGYLYQFTDGLLKRLTRIPPNNNVTYMSADLMMRQDYKRGFGIVSDRHDVRHDLIIGSSFIPKGIIEERVFQEFAKNLPK